MADSEVLDLESDVVEAERGKSVANVRQSAPAAPQSDSVTLMSLIERAARDPEMDLDRMERLFAMHEAMKSKQAESEFHAAMAAAQAEIGPVVAKKPNSQTNSRYADLAAILELAQPIIAKHGLATSFGTETCDVANHYRVTCEVSRGGFSKVYKADIPMDNVGMKGNANKTATHAFGSTMTYGRRYLFCMIFNIATADDDGNKASAAARETLSEKQIDTIYELLLETNSDIDKFFAVGKLDPLGEDRSIDAIKAKIGEIRADQFVAARNLIAQKKKA